MGSRDGIGNQSSKLSTASAEGMDVLAALMSTPRAVPGVAYADMVVGELVAIVDDPASVLVSYPGQPGTAALRARSVVPLRGPHIGRSVVLLFERGDPCAPIVMGVIQEAAGDRVEGDTGCAIVDVDGERVTLSARRELVLRCGKASITLTTFGKVLIQGTYVLNRSTGVNKLMGGSVQLN